MVSLSLCPQCPAPHARVHSSLSEKLVTLKFRVFPWTHPSELRLQGKPSSQNLKKEAPLEWTVKICLPGADTLSHKLAGTLNRPILGCELSVAQHESEKFLEPAVLRGFWAFYLQAPHQIPQ